MSCDFYFFTELQLLFVVIHCNSKTIFKKFMSVFCLFFLLVGGKTPDASSLKHVRTYKDIIQEQDLHRDQVGKTLVLLCMLEIYTVNVHVMFKIYFCDFKMLMK